ncbi:hypothetical protein SADUNF_Sadunf13G0088600 [Salix dunnii]|uniref:SAUR family protein n=1 Tax=Salix dunnii TaxID=1413687 RepID=A0A835ML53_9ROSI|nr:hypothetical protein SADUNF_Sadunf13G0088600 [Salix dunnii]
MSRPVAKLIDHPISCPASVQCICGEELRSDSSNFHELRITFSCWKGIQLKWLNDFHMHWHHHKVELEGGGRTPKGHFAVYVGNEMKRFVVPTSYLKSPIFQKLLDKAAEEFGFDNQNGIVLPCDESTFNRVTAFLAKHDS